jgi:hypothetical protein
MDYRLNDADVYDLLEFASVWASLGDAVQEQVEAVLNDIDSAEDQNPNALRLAARQLRGFNEEIDQVLKDAIARCENEPEEAQS